MLTLTRSNAKDAWVTISILNENNISGDNQNGKGTDNKSTDSYIPCHLQPARWYWPSLKGHSKGIYQIHLRY